MSYRAVVVGLRMGQAHAKSLATSDHFHLVGLCDLDRALAERVAAALGQPAVYTDYAELLAELQPEVVAIATPTQLHATQTLAAVAAGARAVCCEKPMAVQPTDARAMLQACEAAGVTLIVNHQRRCSDDLLTARQLIADGAIGDLLQLRGQCAGDLLSDGTHVLDSLLYLADDREAAWVAGWLHAEFGPTPLHGHTAPGVRFGHRVEAGCTAEVQLVDGPRLSLLCGDVREPARAYQDYLIEGTHGRLWRTGDADSPNLYLADGHPGTHAAGVVQGRLQTVACDGGPWRGVDGTACRGGIPRSYDLLAATLCDGATHPLSGANSLRSFEILTAIAESARFHRRLTPPVATAEWPLDSMLRAGVWG
ncbi:MAG: Gfo/Idh/MocA family oxidoreductase [Fimbriimonadaceae bacterium]|nr:Gfo/Idh/MocA family oxidoreductase [Fimbriimonadaceae bacterium]